MKPLTRCQVGWLNGAALVAGIIPLLLYGLLVLGGDSPANAWFHDLRAWLVVDGHRRSDLPVQPLSLTEQWLAVLTAFGIKPVYMLLALGLILWLWRKPASDLAVLRWGLIWFWVGENGCSIDFLFYARGSDFWEFVHGYGMAAGFSMITWACLEGLDQRLIKFSPPHERCAALRLCGACIKHADVPCAFKRLFTILIPALALVSLLPLTASLNRTAYDACILGTWHNYCHLPSSQLFEWRWCPVLAASLFAASWLVLKFKPQAPVAAAKVLFAAALGPFTFSLLRLFLVLAFQDHLLWFDVWEEATELLFITGIAAVLWVFRHKLLAAADPRLAPA